jgi:TonB-linked SusC/RagA family outer membrane protein
MKKKLIHPSGKSYCDYAQIFRIMKLITLLLFVAFFQLSASTYSQTTRLKISGHNLSIGEIFEGIEKQSEFSFFYNVNQIDLSKQVNIDADNQFVNEILDKILVGTNMTYTINNKLIVIHKQGEPVEMVIAQQQGRKITGKVTDQAGMAIPGASVVLKGTTTGTVTDNNGTFSLTNVPEKSTLACSFVGMVTQEFSVGNKSDFAIVLRDETVGIEEVAVIGYGSVKKRDLTGAVASLSSADIVRTTPANATQALQGQLPGVVVTKGSNLPGQAFSIDIRGENTITGVTEPLVVIDGVIGGRLRDINPADIQSIDILKDASSTAIYGSRGANGVIIITSKKGISGKAKVTVDSYMGIKTPNHMPELQNAQQFYKSMYTDAILNLGTPPTFSTNEMDVVNKGKSTNWVEELTKPGKSMGSTVAVTGGTAGTTYRFSTGYIQEDGNIPNSTFKKYSLNGALDSKINNWLKVGMTAYINYSTNPTGSYEALRSAYRARPTGLLYYSDLVNPSDGFDLTQGAWNGYAVWMGIKDNQVLNPIVEANPANYQFEIKATNEMGNAFAEITLMKGLTFKSSISASIIDQRQGDYRGTYTKDRAGVNLPKATYSTADNSSYTFDNQLNYNLTTGKHKLNATVLQSAFKNISETYSIAVQNLPYASVWYNLGTAGNANVTGVSSSYRMNSLQSYMGRVNYTYDEKYLFTFTGRSDGASQLAEGNKWAFFPSGAFAWRLVDENFIKKTNLFSDLKLRVSYGEVGNSNVSPYSTQASILNTIYSYDQTLGNGFAPGNLGNKDLKWERSQELNLGLNMGFLNNRITAAIEVYDKNTKDLILQENLPTSTGFNSVYANVGKISNKGVEVLVNTRNVVTKDFQWTTSINFSRNKNRIEALANGVPAILGNALFVGQSVKSYYDYKFAGIWQITDSIAAKSFGQSPGSVKVVDTNKDGVISSATGKDDRQVLGTQLPNYIMGMTNRLNYKDFDLSFQLYYRNGTLYNNGLLTGTMGDYTNTRYNHIVLNYWTRNNPTNDWYGVGVSQPYKGAIQYEDASFLRVSDITVGYTMPKKILDRMKIDKVRVYLQVNNPFVFTKYHGMDPEYNSNTYIDDVPNTIFTFGLNLGF